MSEYSYTNPDPVLHVIVRKKAKELGMKQYFTGKLCKNNHLSLKGVSSGDCLECRKSRYWSNKESELLKQRQWLENNRDKRNEYRRAYYQLKKDQVSRKLRKLVERIMDKTGTKKKGDTCKVLGYSYKDFRDHIESLFLDGMTWNNVHIDHKYPVSRFIGEGVENPRIINSLSNLAPMYPEDNLSKGSKTLQEWLDEKGEDSVEWERYSRLL